MTKGFLLTALLFVIVFGVKAQSDDDSKVMTVTGKAIDQSILSGAEFKFDKEIYDFGEIFEGRAVEVTFSFTNVGDQILNLYKVEAGCSCTSIEWTEGTLQPGDSGTIKVTYDTKDRLGEFNKSIRILSDAKQPTKVIRIKGFVKQDFFGDGE